MKKVLLSFSVSLCAFALNAQTRMTIEYDYNFLHAKDDRPAEENVRTILVANDSVSYYYYPDLVKKSTTDLPLGAAFDEHAIYVNHAKSVVLLQSQAFENKKFIIKDSARAFKWEYKDDFKREVAGYTCSKAVTTVNGKKVTVFYAPELPAKYGPGLGSDLPGTILEVWVDGDPKVLSAKSVTLNSAATIVPPDNGKMVSIDKFEKYAGDFMPGGQPDFSIGKSFSFPVGYPTMELNNYCNQFAGMIRTNYGPYPACCYVQPNYPAMNTGPKYVGGVDPNIPNTPQPIIRQ